MIGKQLRNGWQRPAWAIWLLLAGPLCLGAQPSTFRLAGSPYTITELPVYDYTAGYVARDTAADVLPQVIYGRRLARSNGKLRTLAERAIVIPLRRLAAAHKLHCATLNMYTSVSLGDAIKLPNGKRAVIVDYVIKPRYLEYVEFDGAEPGARGKVKLKKTPAIRNLKVIISEEERSLSLGDGVTTFGSVALETKFESVELTPEETKAVIIGRMVQAGQIDNILRAYPEERANLPMWIAKYPKPKWQKPARKPDPPAPARTRRPARRGARG